MSGLVKAVQAAQASVDGADTTNSTQGDNGNETSNGQASLAELLFGGGVSEDAGAGGEGGEQDPEGGEGASGAGGEDENNAGGDDADGSAEAAGGAGGGEGGEGDDDGDDNEGGSAVFCSFDGQDYTEEQVTTALKHHSTFERFGEAVAPIVANIRAYGDTADALKVAATTETDKMIAELTTLLSSGTLDSQTHQKAHLQLLQVQERKRVLDEVVNREQAQRKEAIAQVRAQAVRKVAFDLTRRGWTPEQMGEVEALATSVLPEEAFADNLSIGLMEVLRDAHLYRKAQADTAKKIRDMGKKAVKVSPNKPAKTTTQAKDVSLGSLLFRG